MDIDERLDRIAEDVQFLLAAQRSRDDQIAKLIEEGARTEERLARLDTLMGSLTDQTKNAMDAITRLAHIAEAHEDRLDEDDPRLDDLER